MDDACHEINSGLLIANTQVGGATNDLIALSSAWRARVFIERGQIPEANAEISRANSVPTNPWISFRVGMAAGDVAMKQEAYQSALELYERANKEAESYGGEGHGYQIEPRLGLACVGLNKLDEAVTRFNRLKGRDLIPICRMYADYGLALVALRKGEVTEARRIAEPLRQHLEPTNSGLLVTLRSNLFHELANAVEQQQLKSRELPVNSELVVTERSEINERDTSEGLDRNHVFISYSHKDARFLNELLTHLAPLQRTGRVSAWSDRQIQPGSDWSADIAHALKRTRVAVMLVTKDFLASDFIHEHELGPLLREAEKGGVTILWILVRACSYRHTPLKRYQAAIPPDKPLALMKSERDGAWVKICERIIDAVE